MRVSRRPNPFLDDLKIEYVEINIIDNDNELLSKYEMERDKFNRLYTSVDNRNFIFGELSMYAIHMFLFMQYIINHDYPYIIINYEKVETYCKREKIGRRRFDDTIRELINKDVIQIRDRKDDSFWFNPKYFSSGNRLKMYPDNKIKTSTKMVKYRGNIEIE